VTATDVANNVERIRDRMQTAAARAGRSPSDITLVAVTKTVSAERIQQVLDAGIENIGENRIQEAAPKIEAIGADAATWHLIGTLQSNKARRATELFDVIQSVDSIKLATRLNALAGETNRSLPVLLEVNTSDEDTKHGFAADDLLTIWSEIAGLDRLDVRGLMTIGPNSGGETAARTSFQLLSRLRDTIVQEHEVALPELSMGMTGDFEIAIEEGSTMVRVGRAIFGER
jgi:pyridoxal phosphate enzyme (YggS family)